MLLQRRLVLQLEKYYVRRGDSPLREDFIKYILTKKWPRWNYLFSNKEQVKRMFNNVLGDCINGRKQYMGYVDPSITSSALKVTIEGRDFIRPSYYLRLFLRHPMTIAIVTILLPVILGILTVYLGGKYFSEKQTIVIPKGL